MATRRTGKKSPIKKKPPGRPKKHDPITSFLLESITGRPRLPPDPYDKLLTEPATDGLVEHVPRLGSFLGNYSALLLQLRTEHGCQRPKGMSPIVVVGFKTPHLLYVATKLQKSILRQRLSTFTTEVFARVFQSPPTSVFEWIPI
jgi:hypothetical protein